MSQPHNQYIDPQLLLINPYPQVYRGSRARTYTSDEGNAHAQADVDPGTLAPGTQHYLQRRTHVSPRTVLDGQPDSPYVLCYIQERRAEYCGLPAMPSITFSVNGEPGPSVITVLSPGVQVDGGYDHVLDGHGWRRMQYVIDWPGIPLHIERLPIRDKNGAPITRDMVAKEMCARLREILSRFPAGNIKLRHVRLIALSFYNGTWAPVWAIDSHMKPPGPSSHMYSS